MNIKKNEFGKMIVFLFLSFQLFAGDEVGFETKKWGPLEINIKKGKKVRTLTDKDGMVHIIIEDAKDIKTQKPPHINIYAKKAFSWLIKNQRKDGSWGDNEKLRPALTSVSLLAFLLQGKFLANESYKQEVLNSVKWLNNYFKEDNLIKAKQSKYFAINHSFATYAIAEIYAMTRNSMLKNSVERGLGIVLEAQNKDGGFNLEYDSENNYSELPISVINYMAIISAYKSGAENKNMVKGIQKSMHCFKNLFYNYKDNTFVFSIKDGELKEKSHSFKMTALGLYAEAISDLITFPKGYSSFVDNLKIRLKKDEVLSTTMPFFITWNLALNQEKGDILKIWKERINIKLIEEQNENGSWSLSEDEKILAKKYLKNELDKSIYATSLNIMRILPSRW